MSFWDTFWAIMWWVFWVYIFVAYLMALFAVLIDLFRDHTMKGWAKAIWILFLIFVPILTALIYLIARGSGMAERSAQAARAEREATANYIRDVASPATAPADQIEKAAQLLASGAITEAEYAQLKAKALS